MSETLPNHNWAFISLGSNMEDREYFLTESIRLLELHPSIQVVSCSTVYETEPVGYLDQSAFLNMVIKVATVLPAESLFFHMLAVELQLGRTRELRWGPRTIDLDLLLFNDQKMNTVDLILPHPRMLERAFVLIPLADIIGDVTLPAGFPSILSTLAILDGKDGVKRWKNLLRQNE